MRGHILGWDLISIGIQLKSKACIITNWNKDTGVLPDEKNKLVIKNKMCDILNALFSLLV